MIPKQPVHFAPARLFETAGAHAAGRIDEALQALAKADLFAGAVLIARGEEVLFEGAYGHASREYEIPNTPATRFNLASIGKMFTAVAVLRLAEQGKISLDAPIGAYLDRDWTTPGAARATISQVLSHTGGLGDYFTPELDRSNKALYRQLNDFKTLVADADLVFDPGSRWGYSNTGYLMLGAVLEAVAGASYDDVLKVEVFDRAEMENSGNLYVDSVPVNCAQGYMKVLAAPAEIDVFNVQESITQRIIRLAAERNRAFEGGYELRNNIFTHVVKGGPGGGGFSTLDDMLRFLNALFSGRLVSPDMVKAMITPKPGSPDYGYGMMISDDGSVGHTGSFHGIETYAFARPDDFRLIILSNLDNGRGNAFSALSRLAGAD